MAPLPPWPPSPESVGIAVNGALLPARATLNLKGGLTAVDDPGMGTTDADVAPSVASVSSQSQMFPLRLTVGPTPPSSPSGNDLWISTSLQDVHVPDNPADRRVLYTPSATGFEAGIAQQSRVYFDGTNWNWIWTTGFDNAINWATCPGAADPTIPGNWTHYGSNPIGISGLRGGGIWYESGTLYIYWYSSGSAGYHVSSGADPAHLTDQGLVFADGQQGATAPTNVRIAKFGSTYYLFFSSAGGGPDYSAGFATASSPTGTFTVASGHFPLLSLRVTSGAQTVDAPLVFKEGSTYVAWYHANTNSGAAIPTDIYRATSTDLVNWTVLDAGVPVVKRATALEGDQVADICIGQAPDGFQFAIWTGLNNDFFGSSSQPAASLLIAPLSPVLKLWTGGAWRNVTPRLPARNRASESNGNEFYGMAALAALTSGALNTAVGGRALESATTGSDNVAVGYNTLIKLLTGQLNTAIGTGALGNTTADVNNNVAVGANALKNSQGADNVGVGLEALTAADNPTAAENTAVGNKALNALTSGGHNTGVGANTDVGNSDYATALGFGTKADASGSVAIGVDHTGASAVATAQDQFVLGTANHKPIMPGIPTADPHIAGALYSAAGTVKVSAGASGYSAAVFADTPISYWRLDEPSGTTAADQQAANPGTYTGTFTLGATGATSDGDKAVALTGAGYVSVPDAAALRLSTVGTLECLVKPTNITQFMMLITKSDGGSNRGYELYMDSSGVLTFVSDGGSLASGITLTAGVYQHVAVTWDGSHMIFYRNGVADSHVSGLGASNPPNTVAVQLGARATAYPIVGSLDEPAIYNTALSGARIAAHYAAL